MAETENTSGVASRFDPSRNLEEIIIGSATEALGSAFVVWILGGVAISIAGGFAGNMVPSLPPGFDGPEPRFQHGWWQAVRGEAFGIFFAIFFVHSLWLGFHGKGTGKRLERILAHLRENWFGLIVGNAIAAWVAVLILSVVPNFSPLRMLAHWVWGQVLPGIHQTVAFFLGASKTDALGDWFSWYGANHMKLNFWLIYIAGAFDDMGVPNLKTLARWGWRRMQKRKRANVTAPAGFEQEDTAWRAATKEPSRNSKYQ